jgi:hypothetical protein
MTRIVFIAPLAAGVSVVKAKWVHRTTDQLHGRHLQGSQ